MVKVSLEPSEAKALYIYTGTYSYFDPTARAWRDRVSLTVKPTPGQVEPNWIVNDAAQAGGTVDKV